MSRRTIWSSPTGAWRQGRNAWPSTVPTTGCRRGSSYLDEIANQTNHGMASPHNIRAFLDWAQTNWGVRYAVSAWMRQIYKVTGDIYLPLP